MSPAVAGPEQDSSPRHADEPAAEMRSVMRPPGEDSVVAVLPLPSLAKWAFRREHTGGIDDVSHHHPRADRVAVADAAPRLCRVGDSD